VEHFNKILAFWLGFQWLEMDWLFVINTELFLLSTAA